MERNARILAVAFDLDDTLYPERQYVRSGYAAVAAAVRQSTGRDEPVAQWLWNRFLGGQAAGAFDAMNEHFRLGLSREDISSLVTVYREHRPSIEPFDGTADMLRRIGENYKLGLLTDGYLPAQRLKLEALGLERFFDAVIFTEELGRQCWKPSTVGFEALRGRFGVPHAACAYVSDNPVKDFLPGNQLGWQTIQFLRPGQIHAHNPAPPRGSPQHLARDAGEVIRCLLE